MPHTKLSTAAAIPRLFTLQSIFIFLLLSTQEWSAESAIECKSNKTEELYDQIQASLWNNRIRPVKTITETLYINLGFTIEGILALNEKEQLLTTYILRTLYWKLPFLSWNDTECGITKISYPKSELWMPDILIAEFMDEDKSIPVPYVYLNSSGFVLLDEPKRVRSLCNVEIYKFPFDTQTCPLTFASYTHEANDIELTSKSEEYIMDTSNSIIQTYGQWELIGVKTEKTTFNVSKRTYSAITYHHDEAMYILHSCNGVNGENILYQFYVIIRRMSSLYVVNLLVPSGFLITLDFFSFFLPPENVDRSAFKMTLILGYTVFLLIMNDLLPDTDNDTPLINVYFSLCLALMVASLLETIFIVNLRNGSSTYHKVPHWLHILVHRFLGRLVFMPAKPSAPATLTLDRANSSVGGTVQPDITGDSEKTEAADVVELRKLSRTMMAIRMRLDDYLNPNPNTEEWYQIAKVLDRFLFFFYVIFITASFTTIIILWASHSEQY